LFGCGDVELVEVYPRAMLVVLDRAGHAQVMRRENLTVTETYPQWRKASIINCDTIFISRSEL